MSNQGGRPPIIKTPEELDARVDAYVEDCRRDGRVLTITGLALALGFFGRQSLYQQAERHGFYDSVKRARSIIEADYEQRLGDRSIPAAGTIFALKNFGWADKVEHQVSGPDGGPVPLSIAIEIVDAEDSEG